MNSKHQFGFRDHIGDYTHAQLLTVSNKQAPNNWQNLCSNIITPVVEASDRRHSLIPAVKHKTGHYDCTQATLDRHCCHCWTLKIITETIMHVYKLKHKRSWSYWIRKRWDPLWVGTASPDSFWLWRPTASNGEVISDTLLMNNA